MQIETNNVQLSQKESVLENEIEEEISSELNVEDQNNDIPTKHTRVGNFQFETEPNFSPNNIESVYYGSGDDYFSLGNTIARHPDKIKTIMELYEEFDEELLEDILFDLDKD